MPGVTHVEDCAFHDCPILSGVEFGKLEVIEDAAFAHCKSLNNLDLSSVRIVWAYAFLNCKALTSAIFSDKLEQIYGLAFANCTFLEQITVPFAVISSWDENSIVVMGCEMLKHVNLLEEEALRDTIAALQLEDWRDDVNNEIDAINQTLPNACAGYYRDVDDCDEEEKTQAIWIERVREKLGNYITQHRHFLNEAATTIALWEKSLFESDQASDGVEGAEGRVKKRKVEAAASVPARAESHVTDRADMNVVIQNVLPFLELPPHDFERGNGRIGR